MSRIWVFAACGAFLCASGCVPTMQYQQMRQKYVEENAKCRELADRNIQLQNEVDRLKRGVAIAKINEDRYRKEAELLRDAKPWRAIKGAQKVGPDGKILRLSHLTFLSGSADLTPQGKAVLDQVVAQLKGRNVALVVDGHTDSDPIRHSKHRSNWELSGKRAAAVLNYIVRAGGVSGKNAMLRGFSKYRPVSDKKKENRRVEMFFTDAPATGVDE
jgi:chemotaxis protein MotB